MSISKSRCRRQSKPEAGWAIVAETPQVSIAMSVAVASARMVPVRRARSISCDVTSSSSFCSAAA